MLRGCIFVLITALGDDNFHEREAASYVLRCLGTFAIPELTANRNHPDPEVAHRCRMLIADYAASFRPTRGALLPWIDMLPPDYPDRQQVINRLLPQMTDAGNDWPNYRYATARLVEELAGASTPRPAVIALLDGMVVREEAYRKARGMP